MSSSERVTIKYSGDLKVLVIPDQHFPFVNKKALEKLYEIAKAEQPTHIVNVGDTYDMYSFSRFARSLDVMTPKQEMKKGRKMAEQMWARLQAAAPKAKCFQVLGNHEERIYKKIMNVAAEYESIIEEPVRKLLTFPGVYTLKSSKSKLVINDIVFIHGWSTSPKYHVGYFHQNVVHGHTHRGSVSFVAIKGKSLWELDCGFIADSNALPLEYRETKTSQWHTGCGLVDKYGPRFIPL